jgi:predicted FMN-binding regulatory protein PaiB
MYHFSYFKEKDQQVILEFIENNPFAFLTGSFSSGKAGSNPNSGFNGSKKWGVVFAGSHYEKHRPP